MKTSLSVWEKQTWFQGADIVIAGAGVLGLWTAIEIKRRKPQWRVVVAEANAVPLGASTRNAGFACFGSPGELWHDIQLLGEEKAMQIVLQRWLGIRKIASHFKQSDIGLQWCGGYECLWPHNANEVMPHIPALNGLLARLTHEKKVYQLEANAAQTFGLRGFEAVIANRTEGVLHSGKYVSALAHLAAQHGVDILYGARIDEVDYSNGGHTVVTTRGQLQADKLVWTTNAYLSQKFPQAGIKPGRGQMLLISPATPIVWKGAFHAHEGYYYWRDLDGMLLIGGGRHTELAEEETLDITTTASITAHLQDFAAKHLLAEPFTVVQQWAGLMAFTPDKYPMLQHQGHGEWIATCCNGMGVAISPVFAETVAEALCN